MTRAQKNYQLVYRIALFAVAAVLLAGYRKILFPADFAVSVYRFHLLPGALVNITALYLPWLELVCAFCLLFIPRYRASALWIVLMLLAGFTAAIGINLWRGSEFGCGCFGRGTADRPMTWLSLLRNAGFICLVALALLSQKRAQQKSRHAAG